ncbi:MAG TPA: hypothetical protein VLX92_29265 [Kofleriaceae bacterium]|nr:hypothetical protein [Kofleriaceae bacterium]
MSIARLTARSLRHFGPLVAISAIAMAPIAWIALRAARPATGPQMRELAQLATVLIAAAAPVQLFLVAAAAPIVRAAARGEALGQLAALRAGLRNLVRGIVPCAIAICAIALGGIALVVPGLALLVGLAMTGASERLGERLPAPLVDSTAVARARPPVALALVALVLALDLAIGGAARLAMLAPLARRLTLDDFARARTIVRGVALALIVASPIAACALAAGYSHAERS